MMSKRISKAICDNKIVVLLTLLGIANLILRNIKKEIKKKKRLSNRSKKLPITNDYKKIKKIKKNKQISNSKFSVT